MMIPRQVSKDDIQDVSEMTEKLERAIQDTLHDQDSDLAFSALISATVNTILLQSETKQELLHYKQAFIKIITMACDEAINHPSSQQPEP